MTTVQDINNNDMATSTDTSNPSFFKLFACKCPRCRKGDMFEDKNPWNLKKTMRMNKECPLCGQPLDIEVGFYFGASYVAYALTVALTVATFVAWWVLVGFSLYDNRIFYWLILNAILLLVLLSLNIPAEGLTAASTFLGVPFTVTPGCFSSEISAFLLLRSKCLFVA